MDTDKNYKLIDEVMNCSKADDWQNAKTEWQIVNYTDVELTEDDEHTCVCGKEGLKHLYTIQNTITKKTLFPIGSVCIKKFENEGLNSQLNYWKQLLQLKNAVVGYGKNNRIDFYKDKKKFSRKLIRYMFYLDFINYEQKNFLIDMFNKTGEPTQKQKKYIWVIVNLYIYPGLRKLYMDIRNGNVDHYFAAAQQMIDTETEYRELRARGLIY